MTIINTAAGMKDLLEQARLVARREHVSRNEAIRRVLRRRTK